MRILYPVRRPRLAAAIVLAAAVACSTLEVTTDYDRSADFSHYKSFAFMPDRTVGDPAIRRQLEEAITRNMEAKGFRTAPAGEEPDLWVAIRGGINQKTQIDMATYGYGWYGPSEGTAPVERLPVRNVPVGTVIVDVVDAARNALLWQAIAADTIHPSGSAADRGRNIDRAVGTIFAGFPPKTR